jgi:hypothetical protein
VTRFFELSKKEKEKVSEKAAWLVMVEKGKETKVKVKVTEEIGSKRSGPLGRIRKRKSCVELRY